MTEDQIRKMLVCANEAGQYNKAMLDLASEMWAEGDQIAPKIREGCEDIIAGLVKIHMALSENVPGFPKKS